MDTNDNHAALTNAEELSVHLNGIFDNFIEEVKTVVDAHFASHDLAQEHAQYIFDKFHQASHTLNAINFEMLKPELVLMELQNKIATGNYRSEVDIDFSQDDWSSAWSGDAANFKNIEDLASAATEGLNEEDPHPKDYYPICYSIHITSLDGCTESLKGLFFLNELH